MVPAHLGSLQSSTMLEVIGMQPSIIRARERSKRVECFDTVVVGAGQAGLAVGYHLAERDIDFVIVESEARVGESWRKRWDSLRLFSTAKHDSLPGMCFPAPPAHLPDKDEVADDSICP
jgi:putative flavoprotein involved in K+ transport